MQTAESAIERKLDEIPAVKPNWEVIRREECPNCHAEKGVLILYKGLPYLCFDARRFVAVNEICECGKHWRWYQKATMAELGIEDLPQFIANRKR